MRQLCHVNSQLVSVERAEFVNICTLINRGVHAARAEARLPDLARVGRAAISVGDKSFSVTEPATLHAVQTQRSVLCAFVARKAIAWVLEHDLRQVYPGADLIVVTPWTAPTGATRADQDLPPALRSEEYSANKSADGSKNR
eukprot:SAG11_NODE_64_length_18817_cov_64.238327_10_plen_142_part_00